MQNCNKRFRDSVLVAQQAHQVKKFRDSGAHYVTLQITLRLQKTQCGKTRNCPSLQKYFVKSSFLYVSLLKHWNHEIFIKKVWCESEFLYFPHCEPAQYAIRKEKQLQSCRMIEIILLFHILFLDWTETLSSTCQVFSVLFSSFY